jgi:hypothetical protein
VFVHLVFLGTFNTILCGMRCMIGTVFIATLYFGLTRVMLRLCLRKYVHTYLVYSTVVAVDRIPDPVVLLINCYWSWFYRKKCILAKIKVARAAVHVSLTSLSQLKHVVLQLSILKHYDMIIAGLAMKIGMLYHTTLRFYCCGVLI